MNEDDVERDLQRLLAVDPSPEFVTRVRLNAREQRVGAWSVSAVVIPALAVAMVLAVFVGARWNAPRSVHETASVPLAEAPSAAMDAPPISLRTAATPNGARTATATLAARSQPAGATEDIPEVLVSAADVAAFEGYIAAVANQEFALTPAAAESLQIASVSDVTVPPIAIEPLDSTEPANPNEGVLQ